MNRLNATKSSLRRKLLQAERQLTLVSPVLGDWIDTVGKCRIEIDWQRSPYEALVRAIAHQQLHGKAAASILARLIAAFPDHDFPAPDSLANANVSQLRQLGFSQSKAIAIQGVAAATLRGEVPNRTEAERIQDADLITQLCQLRGVGRWTVEMLLIFTLGRLDVMPADDFGVRAGFAAMFNLNELPNRRDIVEQTETWSPHRSIAAWYLWRLADQRKASRR